MAGMSSEMQRHAEELTTGPVLRAKEKEAKKTQYTREREKKPPKNLKRTYQIGSVRYTGITPEMAKELRAIQKARPELFAGCYQKRSIKKMYKAAEASVTEAGVPEESMMEAGKPEDEEAGVPEEDEEAGVPEEDEEAGVPEASATEAGKAEASVIQAGRPEEAVADMNSAGGDSFIGDEAENELRKKLATLKNSPGGPLVFPKEYSREEIMELIDLKSRDKQKERMERFKKTEERKKALLDIEQKLAKEMNKKKEAMAKAKVKVKDEKAGKAETSEAGKPEEAKLKQRNLLYIQEKLASKEAALLVEERLEIKEDALLVGMDSTGGEPWMHKEDSGKRSEMQRDAEEPLRMEAKAKKKTGKTSKAAVKKSDASNVVQAVKVFEDAEYLDSELQRYWDRLFSHHYAYDETTIIPAMCYTHDSDADKVKAIDTLARGRSLLDSQEQLANKNKKKAKAETKLKDEEAGKAEASVIEAGKPEESVTQAGKAEASVTETGRPVESVTEVGKSLTEASKAAAKKSDANDVLQAVNVFEDAEDFGSGFQSFWDRLFSHRCAYDETTTIPAMCYTHNSDADEVKAMDTLQVISVKVASIEEGLHWPLQVFGMVSARDVLDRKRNIIFHRERDNCQTITEQDPYLTLTGPSRAVVVCFDPCYIEVVLKVKGTTESEDKELSRLAVSYRLSCLINGLYPCELSTLELTFSQVYNSVEATVHVKVTGGSWPDGFKGMFSAATATTESAKVKLLGVGDDGLPVDAADGTIRLSRRVVSVELRGMLKVFVSSFSAAGDEEEHCEASFEPEKDGVSAGVELKIGSCRMEATVAWSLFQRYY